jgi:putative membrane protein insertion efficiency factor
VPSVRRLLDTVSRGARALFVAAIRAYQWTAPMRPPICRYQPTCSEYAAQSILTHGVIAGVALGIRRVLRCNPFSPGGFDPVPATMRSAARPARQVNAHRPF